MAPIPAPTHPHRHHDLLLAYIVGDAAQWAYLPVTVTLRLSF